MTMTQDPHAYLKPVIDLARDAAERIMEIYQNSYSVERKEDRSPLTEADLAAHNAIVSGLSVITPDIPVLSEESAKIPFTERASWQTYWLVDPLDGTREFIKRNGEFTVNIALIQEHRPIMGVIVVPVSGVCYYASTGNGAYKQQADESSVEIHTRRYDPEHLIVAGSRSHRSDKIDSFLAKLGKHGYISMGSSLKSCLVAESKADIYARFGPTSEWDTAAAHCIVEEAGGCVTDMAMQPLLYNTKESLLNPPFFVSGDPAKNWSHYLPD